MSEFKPITLQRIFDLAWQKFVVEKAPPARGPNTNGFCQYLTPDGRKCAVGLALPDGHPAQKSGDSLYTLIHEYPELFDISENGGGIQSALHDDLSNRYGEWVVEDLESRYRGVAGQYGLTVPGEA